MMNITNASSVNESCAGPTGVYRNLESAQWLEYRIFYSVVFVIPIICYSSNIRLAYSVWTNLCAARPKHIAGRCACVSLPEGIMLLMMFSTTFGYLEIVKLLGELYLCEDETAEQVFSHVGFIGEGGYFCE